MTKGGPETHGEATSVAVDLDRIRADIAAKYPNLPALMKTRHLAVLELWAHGLSDDEIAAALSSDRNDDYMTARSVKKYKSSVKDALNLYAGPGINPRVDAMCLAIYWVWKTAQESSSNTIDECFVR